MQIDVSCEVIGRLTRINRKLPANEPREWLRSFFVERRNGHAFVGATDSVFAAIQYLGVSAGENGFVVIKNDTLPLNAWAESDPEDKCTVNEMSLLNYCYLSGATSGGDCAVRDTQAIEILRNWRNWLPDPKQQTGRAMFVDVDGMAALVSASPSGRVVFPKTIDSEMPVIVRDVAEPHWLGVFLARPSNGLFLDGAQRPDWSL